MMGVCNVSIGLCGTTRSSNYLEAELGPPPVPALGVVFDSAISLEAAPLGEGPVLLGGLGENLLHPESLLGRHILSLRRRR